MSDCEEGLSPAQSSVISGTDQGSSEPGDSSTGQQLHAEGFTQSSSASHKVTQDVLWSVIQHGHKKNLTAGNIQ